MARILVSACLLGTCCKYSGGNNLCPAVAALSERYALVPVCPEQLGGLPTPRPPAELQGGRVVNREGQDVTEQYRKGAEEALGLAELLSCRAAVLKEKSPSCGVGAVYDGTFTGTLRPGDGVTAALLRARGIPVISEKQLGKLSEILSSVPENPTDFP